MNRRKFFRNGALLTTGTALLNPFEIVAGNTHKPVISAWKKAKNIIMLVSDGMSMGTLTMADIYLQRQTGTGSNWLNLYRENKVSRGVMDMASASSIVTDSAAASSSWGSGYRVKNGALNIGVNGEDYLPIWQKFKKAGKMAGCVTTVPITHATPAGFCVSSKSRNSQAEIAEKYLDINFDVMMGGGQQYFDPTQRKDKKDLYAAFSKKGYQVVKTRSEMLAAPTNKPLLGVFFEDGLPYSIDRKNIKDQSNAVPTLAEMTSKAIEKMKQHPNGFVLQVEAGKVDWAAHANCIGGLLFDQIAFDEAVQVAMDFAEKDANTLVIITTDHGNANPGLVYGKKADDNFDNLNKFKHTNEWILNGITSNSTVSQIKERIEFANGFILENEEAQTLLMYYKGLEKGDDGLYNYKKLPYKTFAEMQYSRTSVGWNSTDHSADFTEIAMFGPGSENHKPFIKNTDLHYFMLAVAEVENKF
ncbi:MAG: alkaline phosphatase [Flavobacterium sp.]